MVGLVCNCRSLMLLAMVKTCPLTQVLQITVLPCFSHASPDSLIHFAHLNVDNDQPHCSLLIEFAMVLLSALNSKIAF